MWGGGVAGMGLSEERLFKRGIRKILEGWVRACLNIPAKLDTQAIILYSRDPVFIMYAVSNFLTSIGFNVPYVYTVVNIFIHSSETMQTRKCAKFTLEINFGNF